MLETTIVLANTSTMPERNAMNNRFERDMAKGKLARARLALSDAERRQRLGVGNPFTVGMEVEAARARLGRCRRMLAEVSR